MKLWDSATGRELHTLRGHTDVVWDVAFLPDGRRIASAGRPDREVVDRASGQEILTLADTGHPSGAWPVAPTGGSLPLPAQIRP